jgi:hypothetical protein
MWGHHAKRTGAVHAGGQFIPQQKHVFANIPAPAAVMATPTEEYTEPLGSQGSAISEGQLLSR